MRNIFVKMIIALTWISAGSPLFASADTLHSQASFVVHEKDLTKYLQDQTAKWIVPNQIISDSIEILKPYHSWIRNLMWEGAATLNWTKAPTNNIWMLDVAGSNLSFTAPSYEIHDTIVETSNGSTISVQIDAICSDLAVSLPGDWKLHGELPASWVSNNLQVPLQNFSITSSGQAPVFTIGKCTGPTGIDQIISKEINAILAQPAKIQELVQNALQQEIAVEVAKIQVDVMKPLAFTLAGVAVNFNPTAVNNLVSGTWIIDGGMDLQAGTGTAEKTIAKDYTIANLSDARASGVAFSRTLIAEILNFGSGVGLYQKDFNSSQVPALQAFFANRFEQFWVWSDLFNFSTTAVFDFEASATAAPQIQSMTNTFPGVNWNLSAPIAVEMDAPMKKGYVPYVEFTSAQDPTFQVQGLAVNGALTFTYSVDTLSMNYQFRPEYLAIRTPLFGIGVDAMAGHLKDGLQNQQWSYRMPDTASPFPDYRLVFQDLIFGKKTFRVEMALQKK